MRRNILTCLWVIAILAATFAQHINAQDIGLPQKSGEFEFIVDEALDQVSKEEEMLPVEDFEVEILEDIVIVY